MSDFQPNTKFYLLSGIKLDHSNKNQILFDSLAEQQAFFTKHIAKTVEHGTYQRKTVGVINVPFLFDDIASCNYVMWQNSDYSDKWYYAYILSIKYVNPNTSQIIYDLDVFQTYMFDIEYKECYINRQHNRRYVNDDKKRPVLNKEIEDLDYGTDYVTVGEYDFQQIPNVSFLVCAYTDTSAGSTWGSLVNFVPLNLNYIIFPVYVSHSTGEIPNVFFNFSDKTLTQGYVALRMFATDEKLVNTLVSAKLYPFLPGGVSGTSLSDTSYQIDTSDYQLWSLNTSSGGTLWGMQPIINKNMHASFGWIADKYKYIPEYEESKLMMYPYSFGVLTTKRGDDYIVKLEDISDSDINILRQGSISTAPKLGYVVCNYNVDSNAKKVPYADGMYYNQANGINEAIENDLPIIDDYTASYLQSNSNSIKVAKSNAQLIQQSALNQANNTYNTERTILDNKTRQVQNNYRTNVATGTLNAVGTAAAGASLDFVKNVGTAVKGATDLASTMISAKNTQVQEEMAITNSALMAKNTLKNANISATTDYQTTIASVNAKVQDAECVPASAKSLGGDYIFDILHDCDGVYFQWKTIQPYYAIKLTTYFQMYGYKCNIREIPNLTSRKSWNYIKMAEANIFGDIPQDDLMAIRDIFLNGITIWHTEDIGNYNLNNDEV